MQDLFGHQSILDLFDGVVADAPDHVAVYDSRGPVSYRRLDAYSKALAGVLAGAQVRSEDRVCYFGERDVTFPAAVLATVRIGAVWLPIDRAWPLERQRRICELGGAAVAIVTDDDGARHAQELGLRSVACQRLTAVMDDPGPGPVGWPDSDHAAYLTFTSGTTGVPKGVLTSQAALAALGRRLGGRLAVTAADRVLQFHDLSVDISLEELVLAWATGAATVTLPDTVRTDLRAFAAHLESNLVGVVDLPTSFWLVWLEAIERGEVPVPPPSLRVVGVGSEPVPADGISRWLAACGSGPAIYNLYGSTETGITTFVDGPVTAITPDLDGTCIGHPMDAVRCYVLDDALQPVPQGDRGQLYIHADVAAIGYQGDPRATALSFVPDPFCAEPGRQMYAMGDKVSTLPDGRFIHHGRIDSALLVHGFTVNPSDVESVVTSVPGIASARVHADVSGPVTTLVADVVAAESDSGVISGWREVYGALYSADTARYPQGLNSATWFSAVDGTPLRAEAMSAWRDDIVSKILAVRPRRVLELGCGTGMILHGLSGHVDRYVGVDFSSDALAAARADAVSRPSRTDVELIEADIQEALAGIDEMFDVVVINSVLQYLPDAAAAAELLDAVAGSITPGGHLVVGDVRNLDLDETYRRWLASHDNYSPRGARTGAEIELSLSPHWFTGLRQLADRPVTAHVSAKYIDDDSEMTLFRFDVVLRLDATADVVDLHLELHPERLPTADWHALVAPGRPLVVRAVQRASGIASLRDRLADQGFGVEATPGMSQGNSLDLVVFHEPDRRHAEAVLASLRVDDPSRPLSSDPRAVLDEQLIRAVDEVVRARLRAHERPARYRLRRAGGWVTVPLRHRPEDQPTPGDSPLAPTPLEAAITRLWTLVLGQHPGLDDSFFDLGGNSLNLARVLVRLRAEHDIDVSAGDFFATPTVRGLARLVSRRSGQTAVAVTDRLRRIPADSGPASFAQERLWLLDRLNPTSQAYHSPFVFDITGRLDEVAVRVAARTVATAHPVLRTAVAMDGLLEQTITDVLPEVVAIRGREIPADGALTEAEQAFVAARFDLEAGRVFRVGVRQLSPDRHRLLFVLHHIAVDELSLPVLADDFANAYRAAARGRTPDLTEPPVRYLDHAHRERSDAAARDRHDGVRFWRKHLADAPQIVRFPVDRERPVVQHGLGARQPISLPAGTSRRIAACLRREGLTSYQFWFAVFGLFLAREAGTRQVVIGAPSANRSRAETERVIGFFVNTLPVCVDLRTDPTVSEHFAATARALLEAQAHQDVPLQEIVDAVGAHRYPGANPLFQTMVVVEPDEPLRMSLGDAAACAVDIAETTSTMDLSLVVRQGPEGPAVHFVYNPDLFASAETQRMQATFAANLQAVLGDPDRRTSDPIPPAPELASVLTGAEANLPLTAVHTKILDVAARHPQRTAVVAGDQRWTYGRLAAEVARAAQDITAACVSTPAFIPLLMPGSPQMVAAMLAVNLLGAAFVPLSPDWPAIRLRQVLDDIGSPLVLTLGDTHGLDLSGRRVVPIASAGVSCPAPSVVAADLDAPMYAIFTSGSTGVPKAAVVPHRGVANRFAWMSAELGPSAARCVLQTTPPYFDSCVWEWLWPLTEGGTTVLGGPDLLADSERLCSVVAAEQVSILDLVPGLFRALLGHLATDPPARDAMSTVQVIIVGGEQFPAAVADLARRVGLPARYYNLYGPTEASIGSIAHQLREAGTGRVPIGVPIDGTTALVLDEAFTPVPRGVPGELFLGGACVGAGYLGNASQTRARFVEMPGHGRLYRTGDIARVRTDGLLECLGRRDDQIKINGVRMEAGEVTHALESFEGVAEAGVTHLYTGASARRQLTEVVLAARASADPDRIAELDAVLTLVEQNR